MTISPSYLANYLASREEWSAVQPEALLTAEFSGRSFLLTFDDGYRGFHEHVIPLLERFKAHAVLFVTTGFADGNLEPPQAIAARMIREAGNRPADSSSARVSVPQFDDRSVRSLFRRLSIGTVSRRWKILRRLAEELDISEIRVRDDVYMDWDEIRQAARHPLVAIGSHTLTHPRLSRVGPRQLFRELVGSRDVIEHRADVRPKFVSYPHGAHNWAVRTATRIAGYELGFTTRQAWCVGGRIGSRYSVPRQPIEALMDSDDAESRPGPGKGMARR